MGHCTYIGDRLETDAIGAAQAGMRGVWLCRDRDASAEEEVGAAGANVDILHSLSELPALLA